MNVHCSPKMENIFNEKNSIHKITPHLECPGRDRREKRRMKLGTWNVRTLLQEGKLENIKEIMRFNNLDIMGLSEVGWEGKGEVKSDGFSFVYSGGNVKGLNGVGVVLSDSVRSALVKVKYISERVIMVRLRTVQKDLVIIQVYMPTSQYPEEVDMYNKLEEVIEKEKRGACVILMGDWNAVVGEGQYKNIVGKFGLGIQDERGKKLIEFCEKNNLVIGNTMFEQHKRRRYTWINPLNAERHQIDYILIQQRFRNGLKNSKTKPGAKIDSDHKLLVGILNITLKKIKKPVCRKKWETEKFKENKVPEEYVKNLKNEKKLKGENRIEVN